MAQILHLDLDAVVGLPEKCSASPEEKNILERRIAAFAQWELNEFVRQKTGIVNYYGASTMEKNYHAYEKES
jgi:hypothetical protein